MMTRRNGIIVRNVLNIAGVVCICLAVFLFIRTFVKQSDAQIVAGNPIEPDTPTYKVLFLDSYSPTHISYPAQESGIKAGLYANNISYDVIYMDTKNYGSQEEIDKFYDFFKDRLENSNKHYDGVITGDDAALTFVMQHQEELFPDLPIVYYGINNIALAEEAVNNPMMTGFTEETYLDETFRLAGKLIPQANKIVGIYDNTVTGKGDAVTFFSYQEEFPDYQFMGINTSNYTREAFGQLLESLGSDCILMYLTAFEDLDGNQYTIPESSRFIVDHALIPVFRNYMGGEGLGIAGGTQMNFPGQCKMAGQVMSDVLYGRKNISEIPLNYDTPGIVSFDYQVMDHFGLDTKLLPANAEILNLPQDFWASYRGVLIPVIILLVGVMMILLAVVINYMMLKRVNRKLHTVEDELIYKAEHDLLLGIYNSRVAEEILRVRIAAEQIHSVLRIGLDNFKMINDNYGHRVGDDYLKFVSRILEEYCERNSFFFARYSGDEFLIIVPDRYLHADSKELEDIHELFKTPMLIGLEEMRTTVSIGVVNADYNVDVATLMVEADLALQDAKERGKNTDAFFEDELQEKVRNTGQIRSKLVNAIESDGFFMVYQPKIDVNTMELVGYEALLRLKDQSVSPGEFIPVAEQSGLISQIGRLTTEKTIRQLKEWRDAGIELKPVSINYSSNQINDTTYPDFLKETLEKYGIESKYIEIEITEGLYMDNSIQAERLFAQFQEMGIKLLMDDFGTGYSSLSYLTYIPVDVLKLDRSLVLAYLEEGKDAFIRDIVVLAHDLNKTMIVEGVENAWQYTRLKDFGADAIQGFYFSKPLPPEEAANFRVAEKEKGVAFAMTDNKN